jgi:putative membrane protein
MIRRFALLVSLSLLVSGVALTQQTIGQQGQSSTVQKNTKSSKDMATSKDQIPSQNSSAMQLTGDDHKFVMKAAEGGKWEVELGNLAVSKATSADVKQFAQRMVDDHGKAGGELAQLAQSKGITLPMSDATTAVNSSDPDVARVNASATTSAKTEMDHSKMTKSEGQKVMDKLSKLSGADFDREYMKHMVEDHVKDVALFEKEAKNGKDADLKAWAEKTLPTLKEHLQMARDVNAKVGGKMTK